MFGNESTHHTGLPGAATSFYIPVYVGNKYFLGCSLGNLPSKYWYDPLREYSDVRRVQACSSEVATWISPREWDKYTSSITPLTWDYSPVFMGYLLRMGILYSPVNLQCFSTWENHPVLWMNFSRDHPYNPPKWHLLKVTESGYDQHSELWKIHDQWRFIAGKIICFYFYGPYVP